MTFENDDLRERCELAMARIIGLPEGGELDRLPERYGKYFNMAAGYLAQLDTFDGSLDKKKELNKAWYGPMAEGVYEDSFFCPEYAALKLGDETGPLLSFLLAELTALLPWVYEDKAEEITRYLELFLMVYGEFINEQQAVEAGETDGFDDAHVAANVKDDIYWFYYDNLEDFSETAVRKMTDAEDDFFKDIIMKADLTKTDYLYDTGACIGENEIGAAEYLAKQPESAIELAARTYVNGYIKGFEVTGRDISIKSTVRIEYPIGFERIVREAMKLFEQAGLKAVITREGLNSIQGRRKRGAYCCGINPQFDYDHKNDKAVYLDKNFTRRHMEALTEAFKHNKKAARDYAGPAVIEVFGEKDFDPVNHKGALKFSDRQNRINTAFMSDNGRLTNEYIPNDERSFTIIAFPLPSIAEDDKTYEAIFDRTMELNTLDYEKYLRIQAELINLLDQGSYAHVVGCNGNTTDIYVKLYDLTDPSKQTIFENCVADVNIPVGEVFTSPVLEGTYGRLNVKQVYLNGLQYKNLTFDFKDGKTVKYSCDNFESDEENRRYIFENILFRHDWLPIGEFAIGTNTTAYRMARDFAIEAKLPILIAEKTGPHFALGDTCYSEAEDQPMYNPDGKECVARENSCSLKRHEDYEAAYFNCHTDITIPYDELALIEIVRPDGSTEPVIVDGRFVVPGTEELNIPLT